MANEAVIMLCPECKKRYSRQIRVVIVKLLEFQTNVWFKVKCVREGHISLVKIDKAPA